MTSDDSNFIDFLRISLPNFVQFKEYQCTSYHGVARVILFKARFFRFHYCEYKQFKHHYGNLMMKNKNL